ncbi:MAG TPA: DUF1810 domain-containing protein [Acidobacteriaceae bacterium]|nr:DUF1810 domain-containing protein [Acidobacteriaceae bacterium]
MRLSDGRIECKPFVAMTDPFHLQRFVDAQASCFAQVRSELAAGKKRSHWMWFVFPQLSGLGSSPMAQRFAISGIEEARAYLVHPVLGDRLRDCTALVNAVAGRTISDIFGYPDDLKFHSSVTLFACAAAHHPGNKVFREALVKYFDGLPDKATIDRLPPRS